MWGKRKMNDEFQAIVESENPTKISKKDDLNFFQIEHRKFITDDANTINFYTSIDKESILFLQQKVDDVLRKLKQKAIVAVEAGLDVSYPPIILNIFSPGGGVFAAFSFIDYMNMIRRTNPQIKFHTVITGGSASAATLISVFGDKRFITSNGYMLIHQLSGMHWGKFSELEDGMKNSKSLMRRIISIYKQRTKIPEDKIDDILNHDLYWNAKKCLKMGLVDEILD
jgi:ATP-dependent Clp endopeptidase proteolytic subunit ClpP